MAAPRVKHIALFLLTSWGIFAVDGLALHASMESANYIIESDVFSSGGTQNSSSASFGLSDTIGEAIILSATSTSATYGIKAGFRELYADQYLTFTVPASSVSFGDLDPNATKTATQTFSIATNAANGFTVTVSGSPLTQSAGTETIPFIGSTATAATPGTAQFGINLVANTGFGASPSGTAPIGVAADQFNQTNKFALTSGATVATSTVAISATSFTISYIANITTQTSPGSYVTTLTYTVTGSF